jgi:hypothetical protein
MRQLRFAALVFALFGLPLAAAACSEGPTQVRTVPTFSPDCGPLPPPDSLPCLENGGLGSGTRTCC